jgi:hypothetical protein
MRENDKVLFTSALDHPDIAKALNGTSSISMESKAF